MPAGIWLKIKGARRWLSVAPGVRIKQAPARWIRFLTKMKITNLGFKGTVAQNRATGDNPRKPQTPQGTRKKLIGD